MFTIVISEKGGAERRETFDKNEINVGRVQGNDLMLPKGNVSKHHARLLYRDGRFIVTDLKSTNGTYVNGRKISQATIVREGDKIYVGDFVLRLETGQRASVDSGGYSEEDSIVPSSIPSSAQRVGNPPREGSGAPQASPARVPLPPPLPPPAGVGHAAAAPVIPSGFPSSPRLSEPDAVSHYPLERDPDESGSAPELKSAAKVPGPPRMPQPVPAQNEFRGKASTLLMGERPPQRSTSSTTTSNPPRVTRSVPPPVPAVRAPARETPQQAARRLALITLVDRVADAVDLAQLEESVVVADSVSQSIERAVRDQAKAMRREGEAPEGIDLDQLAREAVRELVGLGPIGSLLEDDETTEVSVVRPDYVIASRAGQTSVVEPSFTSEEALARVIARLVHQSGDPLRPGELVVDRRLSRGAYMTAIAPPAGSGWVLHIRKRRRIEVSLADLVRSGAMSEAIASFLAASASVRANVLVVGSGPGAVITLLGAIATAGPPAERVAVLQQGADELALPNAHVVPLALADHGARGEESVYAAGRLGVDRLIVTPLGGAVATATIDVIAEGCEGVLAGVGGPSLRHALGRLVSQVAMVRAGSSIEAAREAVAESFDLVVEVGRPEGGRLQVTRVAELEGSDGRGIVTRDLFVLSTNGAGEPSYRATGVSPRIVQDFGARGIKMR